MRTPEQQVAFEAMKRMEPLVVVGAQVAVLHCAVRALIQTCPEPEKMRVYFDQLLGQIQSYPGFSSSDESIVIRDLVETLFRPPVAPDT